MTANFLFPSETNNGISFSQETIREHSALYSQFYLEVVEIFAQKISRQFEIPLAAATILSREALTGLSHFYLDRLLRLDQFSKTFPGKRIGMGDQEAPEYPDRIEEFRHLAQSSEPFNEKLIRRLAPLLGLEVELVPPRTQKPALTVNFKHSPFRNHNFTFTTYPQKLKYYFLYLLRKKYTSWTGRSKRCIPTMSMETAAVPLRNSRFYPSYLMNVRDQVRLETTPKAMAWRQKVFGEARSLVSGAVEKFLRKAGLEESKISADLLGNFFDYLIEAYPPLLLESIPRNIGQCVTILKKFRSKVLLSADINNAEGTFVLAASKTMGMETIGWQHGGHYGYVEDHTLAVELEYSYFDRYITWGWRDFPKSEICKGIVTVPLPSPWLSERRRYWKKTLNGSLYRNDKPYDFLLLTNKLYRFPPAPSGAAICRIDRVQRLSEFLVGFVREAARDKIHVLHKPYNRITMEHLSRTFQEMEKAGGEYYHCLDPVEKGLHKELLSQCHIVLWDQPGTGFLECLISDIPTMVLWPRIYIEEISRARPLFAELEAAGIVHRDAGSLLAELKKYKASPREWMGDKKRKIAVSRFTHEYARAEEEWPLHWKAFLNSLLEEKNHG